MRLFSRKMTVHTRPMLEGDIEDVRTVGQNAWSDLYSKEFHQNFQVPKRSRKNIVFYLDKEPGGCIVAESDGRIVGDVFCHVWGKVGWFGPVEVLPNFQNSGIGKQLIRDALSYLERSGCSVIGLETMPETLKNVVLYSNLGFLPDRITYLMEKPLTGIRKEQRTATEGFRILTFDEIGRETALDAVRRLSNASMPELDYSREVDYSMKHKTGEALFLIKEGEVRGFSLIYTYSTSDGSTNASIRLLLLSGFAPLSPEAASLVRTSEDVAVESERDRMNVRFYTGSRYTLEMLRSAGYSIRGTNIRMLRSGSIPVNDKLIEINSWAG
jgi:predicted N-acetyltransferase YhbS